MKKRIIAMMMILSLGAASITGCGDSTASNKENVTNKEGNSSGKQQPGNTADVNSAENQNTSGTDTIGDMLQNADIIATVVDFSESGCKAIQGEESEDVAKQAAAGNDGSEGNQISIVYSSNIKFQLATASVGDSDAKLKDSDKSELKKQSNIYLFGTYQEDGTFLADQIIIYRTLR